MRSMLVFWAAAVVLLAGAAHAEKITQAEVEAAQQLWGAGVVAIGKAHAEGGDFAAVAGEHIDTLYGFDLASGVLFKPTLAWEDPFRLTRAEALSYFIGGENAPAEDRGFALAPWTKVRFENAGFVLEEDFALAMGNYYFTGTDGNEVKVEYTLGYMRDDDGKLRIVLQHSSLPYAPAK